MSDNEETSTFVFQGCKHLRYCDAMTVPRQGISLGGQTALCYDRIDVDGMFKLVQFCSHGRQNYPTAGITVKCCSDFDETTHTVVVPVWELNTSASNFDEEKKKHENTAKADSAE